MIPKGRTTGMELFDLAAKFCSSHRAVTVLAGCIVLIVAAFLSSEIEPTLNAVLYVVACFAVVAAILVWLLGARTERDAIIDLMNFGIEAEGPMAEEWAVLVAEAEPHLYLLRNWQDEQIYHNVCKTFYMVLWACLGTLCVYSLNCMGLPSTLFHMLAVLCIVATILCCSSYYYCCVCIWFIGEVSKMKSLATEFRIGLLPDLSPLVFDMRHLASRNAAVFLFVSLLLSIAILACVVIRGDAVTDRLLTFSLLSILAVGYVTFAVLCVCSKIFIDRLVVRWRRGALARLGQICMGGDGEGVSVACAKVCMLEDCAKALGVSCRVSSTDVVMVFLAVITFVVNAVSMVLGFRAL